MLSCPGSSEMRPCPDFEYVEKYTKQKWGSGVSGSFRVFWRCYYDINSSRFARTCRFGERYDNNRVQVPSESFRGHHVRETLRETRRPSRKRTSSVLPSCIARRTWSCIIALMSLTLSVTDVLGLTLGHGWFEQLGAEKVSQGAPFH